MSFDLDGLRAAVETHGKVARVVVVEAKGSTPREPGAAMLVWNTGQSGTIGGGVLEFEATDRARTLLQRGANRVDRLPLGPALGQCCGGAVALVTEVFDAGSLDRITEESADGHYIRRLGGPQTDRPEDFNAVVDGPVLYNGWIAERLAPLGRPLWIHGAGHVGRAIVATMAPLPDWAITWVDIAADRYPPTLPDGVREVTAADPSLLVRHAPTDACHLILTHSHDLDLALCDTLLRHDFSFAGLIGSATKWTRFKSRLSAMGHRENQIERITCPIGQRDLGKHPQAIAIGVAMTLLQPRVLANSTARTATQ